MCYNCGHFMCSQHEVYFGLTSPSPLIMVAERSVCKKPQRCLHPAHHGATPQTGNAILQKHGYQPHGIVCNEFQQVLANYICFIKF